MGVILILQVSIFKASCEPWGPTDTSFIVLWELWQYTLEYKLCMLHCGVWKLKRDAQGIFLETMFSTVLSKGPGFGSVHALDSSILDWKHQSELLTPFQLIGGFPRWFEIAFLIYLWSSTYQRMLVQAAFQASWKEPK